MAPPHDTLCVLPDAERVEHALIEHAKSGGFVDARGFCTLAQLVERCEPAQVLGRRRAGPLVCRWVLREVAQALPRGPFGGFVAEPAFARMALQCLAELAAGELAPADLSRAAAVLSRESRDRADWVASLGAAYERRLAELGLSDLETWQRGAAAALRQGLPKALGGLRQLELRRLYDISPSRLRWVIALGEACAKAGIGFRFEVPGAGNERVDGAVDPVLQALEHRWQDLDVELGKEDLVAEGRPLALLGARLFTEANAQPGLPLRAFAAPSAREETRQIARRIRALVDSGSAPERIAVVFRDLGEEAEWLVEELAMLGLKSRVRLGAPLQTTPLGALALSLPHLVAEGFPAAGVAGLLESRYAPALAEPAVPSVERVLGAAGVRDDLVGAARDRGAFGVRLAELERRSHGSELARQARAVRQRFEQLLELARALPREGPARALVRGWWSLVQSLGVAQALRRAPEHGIGASRLERLVLGAEATEQAAFEALGGLVGELDAALELSGAGERHIGLLQLASWLRDAALDANLPPFGPRAGAVRVLEPRQLAGTSWEHVFLGGLVDGRFPARPPGQGLFSEAERLALNRAVGRDVFRLRGGEPGAERLPWGLAEDRLLLFQCLAAAERTATVSYARCAADGSDQLPSMFLDELVRATGVVPEELARLPVPRLADVHTEAELRERVALELLSLPRLRISEPEPARGALGARFVREPWFLEAEAMVGIERERLRFFGEQNAAPGRFCGRLPPALLEASLRFGPERPLSAESLGRLGNCAFAWLLSVGLHIDEGETAGEELDPRVMGSLLHGALEQLVPALGRAGLEALASAPLPQQAIADALGAAAARVERRSHLGHPALWPAARERALGRLGIVLSSSRHGLAFDGLAPQATELPFGRSDAPPQWAQVCLPAALPGEEPVHLTGKIDRVDRSPERLGVVDYKSGKLDKLRRLEKELLLTQFQLPIYLYAARASGFAGQLEAAWLALDDGEVRALAVDVPVLLATTASARRDAEQSGKPNLANALFGLLARARGGDFSPRPRDCAHCRFGAVCRVGQRSVEQNEAGDE